MTKLVPRTPNVMPGAENRTASGVALAILPEITDRVPRRTVAFTRRNLFERDHRTCQYCGCRPGTAELARRLAGADRRTVGNR